VTQAATERLVGLGAVSRLLVGRLVQARPAPVVALFVLVQWLATLAFALTVHHDGWVYGRGDDQAAYEVSRQLAHGHLLATSLGYGWSILLLPFAIVAGSNVVHALPAIVLVNVLLLMPVAMVATFGVALRLAGRLFGYWTLALWIALPFIGIAYTDAGYKQRYTQLALPDGLGLTPGPKFPELVALAVAAYFTLRAIQRSGRADAAIAGLLAGAAFGIDPTAALFLIGVGLALLASRRLQLIPPLILGVAPCVLALLFWRWQSTGHVSFHIDRLDWNRLGDNLSSVREHFWSMRVAEWVPFAGLVALARRSLTGALLVGGWFFAFVIVEGTRPSSNLESGALLHQLVPVIPAFVLLVAALPFLLPDTHRPAVPAPRPWGNPRVQAMLIAALVVVSAVLPVVLAAVARRVPS
jgi:hypothetical protein